MNYPNKAYEEMAKAIAATFYGDDDRAVLAGTLLVMSAKAGSNALTPR